MSRDGDLGDRIASLSLDHFHGCVPGKGKPKPGLEWTVYATIIREIMSEGELNLCQSSNAILGGMLNSFLAWSFFSRSQKKSTHVK